MQPMTIGFYGMTHLGLVSLIAAAAKGCDVIGYDAEERLITQLNQQEYPINEPEFDALLSTHAKQVRFTQHLDQLLRADLIYLSMDVLTGPNNESDLRSIEEALQVLDRLSTDQNIVVLSQIPPGFMRAQGLPAHRLFYQVETLVFGRAIERATQPERFIVGCADPETSLPVCYAEFLQKFSCPMFAMRYESAELAKIAINMYLVSSVMTSNLLANLASAVGADWQDIVPALRLDKRIGEYAYLNPGLGLSGGNLERDMMTLNRLAEKHSLQVQQITRWIADSEYYKNWVWRCLKNVVFSKTKEPVIAILGLAYKANTHSIKNSPTMNLVAALEKTSAVIQVHDPIVKKEAVHNALYCDSVLRALQSAEALVIMTPWPEYSKLTVKDCISLLCGKIIIDPYRILQHADFIEAGFTVYTLGVHFREELKAPTYA